MFGLFKKNGSSQPPKPPEPSQPPEQFPPVPKWQPNFAPSLELIINRVSYYTNRERDFAVFSNGTCVILPPGLDDKRADEAGREILHKIFNYHPDMKPRQMDDGNIAVQYNHPAINVVICEFAKAHWQEIDRNHLHALATHEVLMTPLGRNKFDDFGKMALYGRCFMFMDAQRPVISRVVRAGYMISPSKHPVAWAAFVYELEDAREHLERLIRDLSEKAEYGESDLRIDLGHVFAHLNRAWNSRSLPDGFGEEQWTAMSRFPTDLEPVG